MASDSSGSAEGLIQIGENVIDVFNAHAQADASWSHAGRELLLRCHLPMRRRCRMAGQRFCIAQVHQALEQLERIVEAYARRQSAANLESHERTGAAAEIFAHQGMVGI